MSYRDIPTADPVIPMCPQCLAGRLLLYANPVFTRTMAGARVCEKCHYTAIDEERRAATLNPKPDPRQSSFDQLFEAWR